MKIISRAPISLVDANVNRLRKRTEQTDPQRVYRSMNVSSEYLGLNSKGEFIYRTSSETTPGKYWYQKIAFPTTIEIEDMFIEEGTIDWSEIKRMINQDQTKVFCDDPSFTYWAWKYMAWKNRYGIEPEMKAPTRNNVKENGAVCKHLYSVFELINDNDIVKQMTEDLNDYLYELYSDDMEDEDTPIDDEEIDSEEEDTDSDEEM